MLGLNRSSTSVRKASSKMKVMGGVSSVMVRELDNESDGGGRKGKSSEKRTKTKSGKQKNGKPGTGTGTKKSGE